MNEIEKILSENPIENKQSTQSIQSVQHINKTKKIVLKDIFTKRRLIIGGVVLLVLIGFLLLPSCECTICNCDTCIQEISIEDIKTQIISKGYAELNNGELKLSPYIE